MEAPICPQCEAVNKPDAMRCHRCGMELRVADRVDPSETPVVLQRVMSGEVFSAVLGDAQGSKEPEDSGGKGKGGADASQRSHETGPPQTEDEFRQTVGELDDIRMMLLEYESRLEARERELEVLARQLLGPASGPDALATGSGPALTSGPGSEGEAAGTEGSPHGLIARRLRLWDRSLTERESRLRLLLHKLYPTEMARFSVEEVATDLTLPDGDFGASLWTPDKVGSISTLLNDALAGRVAVPDVAGVDLQDLAGEEIDMLATPLELDSDEPVRIRTHVEGLDDALEGGIPEGHVVLVAGAPGTLKSTLAVWILHANATRDGVPGLYVSLEQGLSSLRRHLRSFGIDPATTEGVSIFDLGHLRKRRVTYGSEWLALFKRNLHIMKEKKGIRLIVIDSLDALELLAEFEDRRRGLYRLFEWLRSLNLTVILIAERPDFLVDGHVFQITRAEDFLADGQFHLRLHLLSELETQRRIRCMKMRGVRHDSSYLTLMWDDDRFKVTKAMST